MGSLSGGKRGFARVGASIIWPLNNNTLRGDAPAGFCKAIGQSPAARAFPTKMALRRNWGQKLFEHPGFILPTLQAMGDRTLGLPSPRRRRIGLTGERQSPARFLRPV